VVASLLRFSSPGRILPSARNFTAWVHGTAVRADSDEGKEDEGRAPGGVRVKVGITTLRNI